MTTSTAALPRVDPRLRARRIAVRRAEGRRRMRRLLLLLGVTGTLGAGVALTRSPLLDVDHVVIEGLERTARSTATETIDVPIGSPLADVNTGVVAERLEALPWVADAEVERTLPGTVRVVVRERVPVAVVETEDDDRVLVDRTGRVLAAVVATPPDLPWVRGVVAAGAPGEDAPADVVAAVRLAELVPEAFGADAEGVLVTDAGLEVGLRSGGQVLFGDGHRLVEKAVAAAAVLTETDLGGRVLDVRVPTSPVLTWAAAEDIPSTNTRG